MVPIVLALSDLVPATSLLSTIVTAGKQSRSRQNKKPKRANHRAIRSFQGLKEGRNQTSFHRSHANATRCRFLTVDRLRFPGN